MSIAIVTGSSGLVGSETVNFFCGFEDRDRISLAVNFIRHDIEENPYV